MNRIRRGKRLLAATLSALLAANSLPAMALEGDRESCGHHREHTASCGFVGAMPCQHEHMEDCYTDGFVCGFDAETTASGSGAEHTHTQECRKPDCPHARGTHDDTCGYAEARPCGYICQEPHAADTRVKTPLEQGPVTLQSDPNEKPYHITLSPDSITFPAVNTGYTVGNSGNVTPQTVTVNVVGSGHDTLLFAKLDDLGSESFKVESNVSWEGGENGKFSVVTIEPKPGLSAGTYEATLTVDGSNTNAVIAPVKFTVNSTSAFVGVTDIKNIPTAMTAGTPLLLEGAVDPSNATNQTISWSVQNAGGTGASISGKTLSASSAGVVTVKATIPNGKTETTSFDKTFQITVNPASSFVSVTNIRGGPVSMTAGTPLALTGTVEPPDATNKAIAWSVQDAGSTGARLNGNVLSAENAGTAQVMATIAGGTPSAAFTQFFSVEVRRPTNSAPGSAVITGNNSGNNSGSNEDSDRSGSLLLTKLGEEKDINAILISRITGKTRDVMTPLSIFDENGNLIEGSVIMVGTTPHRISVSDNAPDQETIDRLCGMTEGKNRFTSVVTLEFTPVDSSEADNESNIIIPVRELIINTNGSGESDQDKNPQQETEREVGTGTQPGQQTGEQQTGEQQTGEQQTGEQQTEKKDSKRVWPDANSFPIVPMSHDISVGEAGSVEMVGKIEASKLSVTMPTYESYHDSLHKSPYSPSFYNSNNTEGSDDEDNMDGQDQKQEQSGAVIIKAEGVTPDSHIAALNQKNGQWEQEYAFPGNGSVLIISMGGLSTVSLVADRSTLASK